MSAVVVQEANPPDSGAPLLPLLRQFDVMASAPDGMPRLRQLILTLAVNGKLVPQDPRDEPASKLVERLRFEQVRASGEGRRRQRNSQAPNGSVETLPNLPQGWAWVRLSDIVRVLNGRAYSKHELLEAGSTPVLRVGNLFTSKHWYYSDLKLEPEKYCEKGDLLYAWSASFGPFIWAGPKSIYHYHIWKLEPVLPGHSDVEYLYTFLLEKTAEIKAAGHGVSMVHMTKERMENLAVPYPPLPEQARIVARVDELMRLCDALEAKGRLEAGQHSRLLNMLLRTLTESTSPEELAENWRRVAAHLDLLIDRPEAVDVLEQTILHLAVRGLLVPRNPRDGQVECGIDAVCSRDPRARSSADDGFAKSRDSDLVDEGANQLPPGWKWVALGQVAETRLGKMLDKAKNRGTPRPYLRNTNVQWRRFDLHDVKLMNLEESELGEFRLVAGDLLICEGGEPGRCAIWQSDAPEMYFQKALHRVRPRVGVSAEYIAIALECDAVSGRLSRYFTGATIKHFVGQALERYTFPLPPSTEQSRIVDRVSELRRLCADLRKRLDVSQAVQSRLAEALVEQVAA